MKAILFLCLLVVSQLTAEHLFFPSTAKVHHTKLAIEGVLINQAGALHIVPEDESGEDKDTQDLYKDAESRKLLSLPLAGAAATAAAAAAAAATASKPTTSLNSAPSFSTADSPIVAFQADRSITAAAPLCLACTCKVGRTTCVEAGGIAVYTGGESIFGVDATVTCTTTFPCVVPAPDTMSACDPRCRKLTQTCDPLVAVTDCSEGIDATECGTDCQDRLPGDKVVCDQRAIAVGAMNDVPQDVCSLFGHVKRRYMGADHRQRRFLSNSFLGRLIPVPTATTAIPGSAIFSYAPTGRCIPQEIANAPYCAKL